MREKFILNRIRLVKKTNNLIKSNHINERVEKLAEAYIQQNKTITKEKFKRFAKDIQIMVAQELTDKPQKENFQGCIYIGKAKDFDPKKWQKIDTTMSHQATR